MYKANSNIIAVFMMVTLCTGLEATAQQHRLKSGKQNLIQQPGVLTTDSAQMAKNTNKLIAELETVLKSVDMSRPYFTIAGTINLVNKADTAEHMNNVPFLLSKAGESIYYKLGKTEFLNLPGTCININQASKKVFISAPKELNTVKIIDADMIKQAMQSENYEISRKVTGPQQTISLINEKHITCKQYSITFEKAALKITRIYERLSYFREPLNKNKDKIIDIKFSQCSNRSNLLLYTHKDQIIGSNGQLTARYKGYRLIHL